MPEDLTGDSPIEAAEPASEGVRTRPFEQKKGLAPKGLFKQTHKSLKTLLNYGKNQSKAKKQSHHKSITAFNINKLQAFQERINVNDLN